MLIKKIVAIGLLFFSVSLHPADNVYEKFFPKAEKSRYNDTMFQRVVWHRKVSFLVIETLEKGYYVTLLMIPESPYNFKGTTYPLHYYFENHSDAFKKFIWLDKFLRSKGILKVNINGSLITAEEVMKSESN